MTSSSSEEEMDEAFRESAGCDYITRMVADPGRPDTKRPTGRDRHPPNDVYSVSHSRNKTTADEDGEDHPKESGFGIFLAKRLASRLDENIKIVERKNKNLRPDGALPECGIRLFSGSPRVAELVDTHEQPVPSRKRGLAPEKNVNYNERAEEAAVSHHWVKDPTNTAFWKDSKKPRVMSAKVVKNLSNGGLECILLSG